MSIKKQNIAILSSKGVFELTKSPFCLNTISDYLKIVSTKTHYLSALPTKAYLRGFSGVLNAIQKKGSIRWIF